MIFDRYNACVCTTVSAWVRRTNSFVFLQTVGRVSVTLVYIR